MDDVACARRRIQELCATSRSLTLWLPACAVGKRELVLGLELVRDLRQLPLVLGLRGRQWHTAVVHVEHHLPHLPGEPFNTMVQGMGFLTACSVLSL